MAMAGDRRTPCAARAFRPPLFPEGRVLPLDQIPWQLSLNEIYGWRPCQPDDRWSGLTTRLCELSEAPLAAIDIEDVCFLLRHDTGVEVFLERALAWLLDDPLIDAQYYPGDLLVAVLSLDPVILQTNGRASAAINAAERALSDPRADELPAFSAQRGDVEARLERLRNVTTGGPTS